MYVRLWQSGRTTTTRSGRTALSAICRQLSMPKSALPECNGTERCATLRAPRPVPLHHRANKAQMKPGLSSSLDETRGSGQNTHWFLSLADAQKTLEDWRKYYNEERPHGA